ncbi:MAG: hypothetical protein SGPRY_008183 [Prymnesium sp.]
MLMRVMPLLEASFRRAKAEHAPRIAMEAGIRRRYFHVKPLDPAELTHWCKYLDWEEATSDLARCVTTYERCLVPCCQSQELWKRYASFLVGKGEVELARQALARASGSFLSHSAEMILAHANFEEGLGELSSARALCAAAVGLIPPRLEACLAAVNLERRAGDLPRMRAAYKGGIELLRGEALCYLVRHGARYERQLEPGGGQAEGLIEGALDRWPGEEGLWSVRLEHAMSVYERASESEREEGLQVDRNTPHLDPSHPSSQASLPLPPHSFTLSLPFGSLFVMDPLLRRFSICIPLKSCLPRPPPFLSRSLPPSLIRIRSL